MATPGSDPRTLTNIAWTQAGIAGVAAVLAVVAWVAALVTSGIDQDLELQQAKSQAANIAHTYEEQVYRQITSIDQTLRIIQLDYERDQANFDQSSLQRRASSLSDVIAQMLLLDARGRVVTGTRGDLIEADYAGRQYFQVHRRSTSEGAFISGPVQSAGLWALNVSRRLTAPRGLFAGVVVASYDLNALMRDMALADIGPRGMILLVGRDGIVRAIAGRGLRDPGEDISPSTLFRTAMDQPGGSWVGESPSDGVDRIFAFHTVAGLDMTLVVGLERRAALATADMRERNALLVASFITALLVLIAIGLGQMVGQADQREQRLARDRAVLSAANAQLAAARERADQKSLQLQSTVAGMSDGVSMFDADLRLVEWNDRFADLAGVPRNLLVVGLPVEEMLHAQALAGEFGKGVDVEAEVARRMAEMSRGIGPVSVERRRPDGRMLELRRTFLPEGGCVTLYSDVTARAAAEVVQRRAREQAERAAQEKSRFVAIVSHEIRTPLNVAINAMGLLDRSTLSPAQRQLVETGLLAGDALVVLLNDILDLSRMQVGRLALRPAPFSLRTMLEGVVDMFSHQATERGIALSYDVEEGLPDRLLTDGARLRQILMNLVGNAVKFAAPGPAVIEAVALPGDGAGGDELRLAVFDSGPDIPDLERARLFRPFSQLERQSGGGGTGLGLAICQLLANLLGGQIGCDAVPEGGKAFWLTLPGLVFDVGAPPPEAAAAAGPAVRCLPRTRVLLVEDVPANQMIVAAMLRQDGHMVDIAGDGLQALAMVEARPYDVVLMDIFMPGIDGLETSRRLRARAADLFHPPIVALTANVSPDDMARYRNAGIVGLVPKPVSRELLAAALTDHVWRGCPGRRERPESLPAPAVPATAHRPAVVPVFDAKRMADWQRGLPAEACHELMRDCATQLHAMLGDLHASASGADTPGFRRVTHAMVGVSATYGFLALEQAIRAAQKAGPGDGAKVAAVEAEVLRLQQAVARDVMEPA